MLTLYREQIINDPQNSTQKTEDWATNPETGDELMCCRTIDSFCSTIDTGRYTSGDFYSGYPKDIRYECSIYII